MYDEYLRETLESPDEIYKSDDDGDITLTYIKSFQLDNTNFFYIVLGGEYETSEDNVDEKVMIPILGFPSVDNKLYPHYTKGKKVLNNLKN